MVGMFTSKETHAAITAMHQHDLTYKKTAAKNITLHFQEF